MIGVVVVTHCHLAEELICAAQLVVGEDLKQFQAVSVEPKDGSDKIREKIVAAIRKSGYRPGSIDPDGHVWRNSLQHQSLLSGGEED